MPSQLISNPPKKFTASATHDGGTEQATANVKESRLAAHAKKRNQCLKVAANASLIQQEADLDKKGFRSMKAKTKVLSLTNVTTNAVEVSFKSVLRIANKKSGAGARGLNLSYTTEKNLVEGVKRMPAVYSSSYSSENVKESFVASGRTDEKYKTFPDGKAMLETIKRTIEPEEYDAVDESFTEMNIEAFNRGMVTEATFDTYGFKLDATSDGNEEERNFGISQERRQRWKWYGHPVEIESRKKHAERTKGKVAIARMRDEVEISQALALNKQGEAMAHASAGRNSRQVGGNARRFLSNSTIDHFGAASFQKKYLRAFAQVRVTDGVRRKSIFSFDRNRGNIEEVKAAINAKAAGEAYDEAQFESWIYIAWSLRGKSVIMKEPTQRNQEGNSETDSTSMPDSVRFIAPPPPSAPTNMATWVEEANELFDGVVFSTPNEEMVHRRDFLLPIVAGRFIQRRNESLPSEKQDHYSMKFVSDNLERLCNLSLLAGHIVPSLADTDEFSNLLLPPDGAKLNNAQSASFKKSQGVYAYWDAAKKHWIRVGQVSGNKVKRNFGKRHQEHCAGSKHTDPDSIDSVFYFLYADNSVDMHEDIRKAGGKFQDLDMHVIWALSRYGLDNIGKEGRNLFHWDEEVVEGIQQSKALKGDMEKKKKAMVIYLIEFFYSLLLSPHNNVSLNPGFEAFLSVINHGKQIWLAD